MTIAAGPDRTNPGRARPRPAHRTLAAAAAVVALVLGVFGASAVQAAPPTDDPATAAGYGARWLAARFDPAGFVPGPTDAPSASATLQDALALAAAGTEEATFDQAMVWLQANAPSVILANGFEDPGRIGTLLLLADVAGIDPTSFGGVDLPATLLATEGAFAPGLFGAADPTFDGTYRQSLAILGLLASGTPVPATASGWLVDQQCDGTTPGAEGGWMPFRADPAVPCMAPSPITYEGPDTNGTALAVQALAALGIPGPIPAALDFLDAAQGADGGFPYIPGGDVDPNSTALVLLGILAGGEDPSSGRWVVGSADPISSLLSWQVGCDAAPEDVGGFASPFSGGAPDPGATGQAVWGAAMRPFPLGPVTFSPAPEPCAAPTTTTTAPSTTSTTATPGTTAPAAPAAQPVVAQPTLAG